MVIETLLYAQDRVPHGRHVWILHPLDGLKHVVEGFAIGYDFSNWTHESQETVDALQMLSTKGV